MEPLLKGQLKVLLLKRCPRLVMEPLLKGQLKVLLLKRCPRLVMEPLLKGSIRVIPLYSVISIIIISHMLNVIMLNSISLVHHCMCVILIHYSCRNVSYLFIILQCRNVSYLFIILAGMCHTYSLFLQDSIVKDVDGIVNSTEQPLDELLHNAERIHSRILQLADEVLPVNTIYEY